MARKYRFGCGEKFPAWVPRGYDYREIKVTCGSTSPSGYPWQCEKCEKKYAHVNYRADAAAHGESW